MKTYPDVRELVRSKILLNSALWAWIVDPSNHHYVELAMEMEEFSQNDWLDYLSDIIIAYNQYTDILVIEVCIMDYDHEPWTFAVPMTPTIEESIQRLAYKAAASGDPTKFYVALA